ncbi:MAG: sulfurtransferase TusA family protein [Planctomycetota bacterium]
MSTAPPAAAVCDGGDLDCGSGLLLIIRSAMQPLQPGEVLEVRSRETSVREDLPAWCRMVGHALLHEQDGADSRSYFLRKKGADDALDGDLQQARDHVWQVRSRWSGGMQAKVSVRNHGLVLGQPASFDTDDPAPSAIEFLLAAVAGALTTGLQWRLSRRGIAVRNLEVIARGRADDILVFLEVENHGNPGLREVAITVYADADLDADAFAALVQETARRCPVTQSLLRTVAVPIETRVL